MPEGRETAAVGREGYRNGSHNTCSNRMRHAQTYDICHNASNIERNGMYTGLYVNSD